MYLASLLGTCPGHNTRGAGGGHLALYNPLRQVQSEIRLGPAIEHGHQTIDRCDPRWTITHIRARR